MSVACLTIAPRQPFPPAITWLDPTVVDVYLATRRAAHLLESVKVCYVLKQPSHSFDFSEWIAPSLYLEVHINSPIFSTANVLNVPQI